MFGIDDPGIYITYLMMVGCLIFSLWYGISKWNEKEEEEVL